VFASGWVLLGEVGKFVAVSPQRFLSVTAPAAVATGLEVTVNGTKGESIRLVALRPATPIEATSAEDSAGTRGSDWQVVSKDVTFAADGPVKVALS
jgi:hypothetical protein